MQAFNFTVRQSTADSIDDNRSRYVPSSIYSGPGPVEESPVPPQPMYAHNGVNGINGINGTSSTNSARNTYRSTRSNSYTHPLQNDRRRKSTSLNTNDPVTMHLLAETALGDSKEFEVVSFEELEHLKRDRLVLRNRVEATKKKIALECKLRDAAQSLNRLYTKTGGSVDLDDASRRGHTRNPTGSKSSNNEALHRANDEFLASSQKIEQLGDELKSMEIRLEHTQRRILEHTAGILQMTHKGLKKNVRKNELPRSPDSMNSHGYRAVSGIEQAEDFDERSLYPVPDYVHEFAQSQAVTPIPSSSSTFKQDTQAFDDVVSKLHGVGQRMHDMMQQLNLTEDLVPPSKRGYEQTNKTSRSEIDAHFGYISSSLEILVGAQQRTFGKVDDINIQIRKMVEKTNSVSRSPSMEEEGPESNDLASHLTFSSKALAQLETRVENLLEQKDILTRQIQQQRELNTKSDAQRDAQIRDLTEELEETKRVQTMAEQEAQELQNQISLLIEQLDRTKQDALLLEQQQNMNESKALQAERNARKAAEEEFLHEIEANRHANTQLQADMAKMQNDFEMRSQHHISQLNEASTAKEEASVEAKNHQAEAEKLLEQMAALQTELTIVKAELDGAYGSRAQRAADVSLNPAVQKEIDSLGSRNAQLQKELRDTIEDYEQMTKASIEFEKERDQFESLIDALREKCESLESQLSEEKLRWLGIKAQAPTETTSTMVLKNEFKKMMRDTRTENVKALRAEQEERRRLEAIIRSLKKDAGLATPAKSTISSQLAAEPATPSASR